MNSTSSVPGPDGSDGSDGPDGPDGPDASPPDVSPQDRVLLASIQSPEDRQLIAAILALPSDVRRSLALIVDRMADG